MSLFLHRVVLPLNLSREYLPKSAHPYQTRVSFAVRAIRNERYQYVWNPQAINELHDLDSIPYAMKNLAGDVPYAALESQLHHQLMTWLAQIGDNLPCQVNRFPPGRYDHGRGINQPIGIHFGN